jgi:hypothetical protein
MRGLRITHVFGRDAAVVKTRASFSDILGAERPGSRAGLKTSALPWYEGKGVTVAANKPPDGRGKHCGDAK